APGLVPPSASGEILRQRRTAQITRKEGTMSTTKHENRLAIVGEGTVFDGSAYWAILAGVYLMAGGLAFYSDKAKVFDDNARPTAGPGQGDLHRHLPGRPRGLDHPREPRVRRLRAARRKRAHARVPAAPRQVAAPVRALDRPARVRVSRVRPARDAAVLGHR